MAQNIRLEPLAERHLADMAALLADPDVVRFTRVPEPVPPGFAETWLGSYETARIDGSREASGQRSCEGVMRSQHLKQGIRIDAALWSRLPTDPEPD